MAITISGDGIPESSLQISNTPTNGQFLSAQSGNTGGLTWAASAGGGGAMEFISKTTVTGTPSSIGITGLDDDSVYKIIFPYLTLSANEFLKFKMYDHTDTLISADYSYRREDSSVLTVGSGGTEINGYGGGSTTNAWNAEFTLVTKQGNASFRFAAFPIYGDNSDGHVRITGTFDTTLTASGIGGLYLYPTGGTFTGGQYRIYKIKDS